MAFRTWAKLLGTTLGVAALAGASQLGLAYGLGVLRLTRVVDLAGRDQWTAQLAWVAWIAMTAAVLGGMAGRWLRDRWRAPATPGTFVALSLAAGLGAALVVPLTMQPARTARIDGVHPVFVIGTCATLGAAAGVFAAYAVLTQQIARRSLAVTGIAIWTLAVLSLAPSLGPDDPLPAVRLGVFDPGYLSPALTQRTALFTMPALALITGAILGYAARRRELPLLTIALAGLPGPALLTLSYLIAGPGSGADRYQVVPYWAAMTATGAGVLGSVLAAVIRRGPDDLADEDDPSTAATGPRHAGDDPATTSRHPADRPATTSRHAGDDPATAPHHPADHPATASRHAGDYPATAPRQRGGTGAPIAAEPRPGQAPARPRHTDSDEPIAGIPVSPPSASPSDPPSWGKPSGPDEPTTRSKRRRGLFSRKSNSPDKSEKSGVDVRGPGEPQRSGDAPPSERPTFDTFVPANTNATRGPTSTDATRDATSAGTPRGRRGEAGQGETTRRGRRGASPASPGATSEPPYVPAPALPEIPPEALRPQRRPVNLDATPDSVRGTPLVPEPEAISAPLAQPEPSSPPLPVKQAPEKKSKKQAKDEEYVDWVSKLGNE